MSDLTRQQKRDYAKTLYLSGNNFSQKEIAEKTGVSAQTLSKWVNLEKWDELKASVTITREQQLKSLYTQIAELNKAISEREKGQRFATNGEADTISKLANSIKKLETDAGISDIVSVSIAFCEFVKKIDLKKAQEIAALFEKFIEEKL